MLGRIDVAAQRCNVLVFSVSCACALGTSCADPLQTETRPEQSHLFEQRLPALGCYEEVDSPGNCRRSADCVEPGERCVRDPQGLHADRAPVPLTCAPAIGAREAHTQCTSGDECASGLCSLTGLCLEPCASDQDCRIDDACRPVETRLGDDALAPVMACARALVLPADVDLTVSPRGYSLGRGKDKIAVPGAQRNALVYLQGMCGEALDVLTLRSNDLGRMVYDRDALRTGKRQENTILHDGSALAALIFPNNPALLPMAGGLELGVRVDSAQHAELVIASRAPGRGVLDLNVFYVGGGSELVEGGFHPGEPRVAAMLEAFDARLQDMGLSLGKVSEFDVVGALREELAVLNVPRRKVGDREVEGRPERLDELFRLSAGLELPGVNVFIVGDMGDYIGIAGGIPGPLGLHGSERSGLALAADLMGDLVGADQVLLHEIGHYLGLFHTSESSGTVLDPLSDTPECDRGFDTDEDGFLSTAECEGRGAENLMFWTGPGTLLSAQQIQVFASAVVLR